MRSDRQWAWLLACQQLVQHCRKVTQVLCSGSWRLRAVSPSVIQTVITGQTIVHQPGASVGCNENRVDTDLSVCHPSMADLKTATHVDGDLEHFLDSKALIAFKPIGNFLAKSTTIY